MNAPVERSPRSYSLAPLPLLALVLVPGPALAATVTVKVVIERVRAIDSLDPAGLNEEADFYYVVRIGGKELTNRDTPDSNQFDDMDDISPNWQPSWQVDVDLGNPVPIPVHIGIWDEDSGANFDDDHTDLTSDAGSVDVELRVDYTVNPCAITQLGSGDPLGVCFEPLESSGTSGGDRAMIRYHIEVGGAPCDDGLCVSCLHGPIVPNDTQAINVTASALDASLNQIQAETIEVYINDRNAPVQTASMAPSLNAQAGPFPAGSQVFYGCRVLNAGVEAWSGWKIVQVTPTAGPACAPGRAIPVLNASSRGNAVDILFLADVDSYPTPVAPTFQSDVNNMIQGYYNLPVFLQHQDQMNFWMACEFADAADNCDSVVPGFPFKWYQNYGFADAAAIVHAFPSIRDCAPGGSNFFSVFRLSTMILRHETGHRPFGLADEYCFRRPGSSSCGIARCDGGYFQADPHPNLYKEPDACMADAPDLGRSPDDCTEFNSIVDNWFDPDWSVSEPVCNDLMVDNTTPQAADLRRINWLFDMCRSGAC